MMGASTKVMGGVAAAHPCVCSFSSATNASSFPVGESAAAVICCSNGRGISSGGAAAESCSLTKLSVSAASEAAGKQPHSKALRRQQSSLFSLFSAKQHEGKGRIVTAAAKRRPKQNSKKTAEKLAASLGLSKADQENGVLDFLELGSLNGNWLSKDDDFDDLDGAPFLDAVVKVLASDVNIGYEDIEATQVSSSCKLLRWVQKNSSNPCSTTSLGLKFSFSPSASYARGLCLRSAMGIHSWAGVERIAGDGILRHSSRVLGFGRRVRLAKEEDERAVLCLAFGKRDVDPLYVVGDDYESGGPIELPPREIEIDPFAIPEASPAQIVASICLTGAIAVLSYRALRKRAARSKEMQFRSSGIKDSPRSIKEEARKTVLDNLTKAPEVATPPPSAAGTAFGAIVAGVIALGLYKFTSSVEAGFSVKAVSQDYSIRNLTITVRTIITGLCYLATFVFAANSIGLTLYAFQLLLGIGIPDPVPPSDSESDQKEESSTREKLETEDFGEK